MKDSTDHWLDLIVSAYLALGMLAFGVIVSLVIWLLVR